MRAASCVGINTNRLGEGFYLALPADAALRERVDALGRGESVERPRLGVAIAPVARRPPAAPVGRTSRARRPPGSRRRGRQPGGAAGIQAGDLIVEAGGKPITDADDLLEALAALELPYEVKVVRGTDERTVQVGGGATATGEA